MKIQVETITKTKKEIEVDFPYYTSNDCHYFKVVNEKEIIVVCTLENHQSISRSYLDFALKEKPCKKKLFDKAFANNLKYLSI
jgi:hypothetical protein